MADFPETLIDRFLQDQDDVKDTWLTYAINPYTAAYEAALTTFNDTLARQKADDEARQKFWADLLMLGLSMCGGGLLTAAFGKAAIGEIIIEEGTSIICNRNMERAFQAAHFLSTNKVAAFAVGKIWDEVGSRTGAYLSEKVSGSLAAGAANYPSTKPRGTMGVSTMLENFILETKVKNAAVAKEVRDGALPPDQKLAKLDMLKKSPLMSPPQASIDPKGTLSDDIELGFYLNMVLRSDSILTMVMGSRSITDGMGHGVEWYIKSQSSRPINDPSTSQAYLTLVNWGVGLGPNDQIVYEEIGSTIRGRMNELHKARFGTDLMTDARAKPGVIIAAEAAFDSLASSNIQRTVQAIH